MATKTIDSDLIIRGEIKNNTVIMSESSDDYIYPLILKDGYGNEARFATKSRVQDNMVGMFSYTGSTYNGGINFFANPYNNYKSFILSFDNPITGDIIIGKSDGYFEVRFLSGGVVSVAERSSPITRIFSKQFIVPNGTNKQFLKADGSLDSTEYATAAELTTAQNNAWKLSEANAEVESVVLQLTNKGIFETMTAAKINPLTSRNIYVDLSKAESTLDIFAGYKDLPVGVRYHIFFGNTSQDVKLNWTEAEIESNIAGGTIGLTSAYPSAKCEFMRVTEAWTYADWEAKINNVSHLVDTGTLDDTNNSILQGYLDKNGISYEKTAKGSLFNLANMLASLAGGK